MSSSADFPGNCITNTHILHDFAEIAYIVCTHAIPASSDNTAESTSPAKVLDRLRNAERQFRQHSILVALDIEKLELFTFYRKVDVVKDQRTILSKFGYVCRLNSCIIANKSAARILDLLKPESSRIYRLFASAILSSIQISLRSGQSTIAIGTRISLAPSISNGHAESGSYATDCSEWHIHRVNLQIVPSGQLVLTVQDAKNAPLYRLSDLVAQEVLQKPPRDTLVYLAPSGQIARYTDGIAGTRAEISSKSKITDAGIRHGAEVAVAQIPMILEWLRSRPSFQPAELNEATWWIQIEVPVLEEKDDTNTDTESAIVWRSLMWPSECVFVFEKNRDHRSAPGKTVTESDPLKFVLDWYNGSAERNGQLTRAQVSGDSKEDADDDHVFADDMHFEDHYTPQVFGPPVFPASQMVYPTPPEAILAHQTPGVFSVDGLAPTPAPVLNVSQPDSEPFFDQDMPDVHEQQASRAGTGFYDEDLFEEIPDDKFTSNADADEPNWDFFDAPGFESSIDAVEKSEHFPKISDQHNVGASSIVHDNMVSEEDFPAMETPVQQTSGGDAVRDIDLIQSSPVPIDSVYGNELNLSPTTMHHNDYVSRLLAQSQGYTQANDVAEPHTSDSPLTDPSQRRRRSSIFEGMPNNVSSNNHDLRYSKHGKFWFEDFDAKTKALPLAHSAEKRRTPSSGSDTSLSSNLSGSNLSSPVNMQVQPLIKRAWTEYQTDSPVRGENRGDDIDRSQIRVDTQRLLSIVATATGEDPFLVHIEPLVSARRRPNFAAQKAMMIAQVLIDQTSQSSLLRDEHIMQLHQDSNGLLVDVTMDYSGGKSPISHATLSELTSMHPKPTAKLVALSSRSVCVKRTDVQLIARQSILPFWDTLGLQPHSGAKHLTAFCIHPSSSNVAEGSAAFLSRISDTYASCNLGTHTIGRAAGLTNDGLLAWTPQNSPGPNLKQQCQRLGAAIGATGTPPNSSVVVYIISPSKDSVCYREVCHAFTFLFETLVDTSEGARKDLELILQIVPLSFIAAADTIVVANQDAYLELALEVHNRVPLRQNTSLAPSCGSAVVLETQLRDPAFELSSHVVSPLSKDGPCLHLAYSYSIDRRWLVAAWSDECGTIAFTMCYCFCLADGSKSHTKREIFRNMWDVSHDVMGQSRVKWRLIVAHTGFYDVEDREEWQHLVSQGAEERKTMSRLMLLSIDLGPDIFVEIPATTGRPAHQHTVSQAPNVSGTPVSTPQTHITSPEQLVAATPTSGGMPHTNAATPPDHALDSSHDTDITLIDPADQSWAVVLSYGLNQSSSFLDVRPAAASGFLVKRTGSKDEGQGLRFLGVNLVAAPRSPPGPLSAAEKDALLLDVLEQYRGLVTLAVSRGCIDKNNDCVPWHVATAVKGARVLSEAM